jgi:hypothetical protein
VADLLLEVTDYPVDLLQHGLGNDLHFYANLYRCNRTARYSESLLDDRFDVGHDFPERAVAASGHDTPTPVLSVYDASSILDPPLQLSRSAECEKVFVDLYGDRIAETGPAVEVGLTGKGLSEGVE